MKYISKANKVLIGLIIVGVITIVIGLTYAYFTAEITGNEEVTTITATSGNMKLVFNGGPDIINVTDMGPSTSPFATKTFTVTGTNTVGGEMKYDIFIIIDENTFTNDAISYTLEGINVGGNGALATNTTERVGLNSTNKKIGTGSFNGKVTNSVHSYTLKVYFYETGANQSEDMEKTFKAHLKIAEYKNPNYQVVDAVNKITIDMHDNLIPVTYDGNGQTIKSNTTSGSWYNYSAYKWANAVLVTESSRNTHKTSAVGTVIPEADILAYYVWIPRYRYTLWNVNATGGVTATERQITVNFQLSNETVYNGTTNGSELTHPAFWWDKNDNNVRETGEELNGFWVGKFENSADPASSCYSEESAANCDVTTIEPRIKPNVPSLRYQKVSNMWTTIEKFKKSSTYGINESGYDSHMMKNMEWGAVAYLSNSQYGNRGNASAENEIYINPSSSFITGRSGNAVSQGQTTDTSGTAASTLYAWNGKSCSSKNENECTGTIQTLYGPSASTTGTIYGVYDMSGGSYEYVMGNMNSSGQDGTRTMQVSSAGTEFGLYDNTTIPKRYYDSYNYGTTYNDATAFTRGKLGDATKEVMATVGSDSGAWNSDSSNFVYSADSWFVRCGRYVNTTSAGIWNFLSSDGIAGSGDSARSVFAMTP